MIFPTKFDVSIIIPYLDVSYLIPIFSNDYKFYIFLIHKLYRKVKRNKAGTLGSSLTIYGVLN